MSIKLERLSLLLLVVLFAPPMFGGAQNARQDSVSLAAASDNVYPNALSFAAELERIGKAIEEEKANPAGLAVLGKSLPSQWEIDTGERRYSLSAAPLGELLYEAGREKNAKDIAAKAAEGAHWAFDLANQVKAYAGTKADNGLSARPSLERILSRREFGSVHGPSAWDLFRQRANRWIEGLLLRLFRQIGRYPMGASVLFWLVMVAVVLWLAVFLFRYWMRRTELEELQAPETVVFVRTWQEWIKAARQAATRGDFREAVHAAYWAGISYLEDSEVVRKDRTRTPREYMRLVSNATQLVASGRKTREALSALTVALEQVWYGSRPVSKQDFANAMQSVEALGCQLQ